MCSTHCAPAGQGCKSQPVTTRWREWRRGLGPDPGSTPRRACPPAERPPPAVTASWPRPPPGGALAAPAAGASGTAGAWAGGGGAPPAAGGPFDRRRNGFVLSEGAGVLVLESPAHADARGAAGYGDVVGWGATTDAYHPTTPRPDGSGAAECMRRALSDAGIAGSDVGYLNAHGTGTKLGDAGEARAVRMALGESPPVGSTRRRTGHILAASRPVHAAVTLCPTTPPLPPPPSHPDAPHPP